MTEHTRRTPRDDPYAHGGVIPAGNTDEIKQAAERRRGRIVVRGASDRPFNAIDAMNMGQEDYRDRKPAASRGLFMNRANAYRSLRLIGRADLTDEQLFAAYIKGYKGEGVLS